jgi:hypothetical protein
VTASPPESAGAGSTAGEGASPGPPATGWTHDERVASGFFSGAALPDQPYADDDGRPDEAVVLALGAYAQGVATGTEVLEALARSRLLVPVVAVLESETDDVPDGGDGPVPRPVTGAGGVPLRREKESSMATVTVEHPDGSRALLAFTGAAAMHRWRPDARPLAVPARRAAQAALAEGADLLLLDVAGPRPFGVDGVELRSLAFAAQVGLPLPEDPQVVEAVTAVLAGEPAVLAATLAPGLSHPARTSQGATEPAASGGARDRAGLRITLVVDPAVGAEGFRALVTRASQALAADVVLRSRVPGGLQVAVVAPGHEEGTGVTAFRRGEPTG